MADQGAGVGVVFFKVGLGAFAGDAFAGTVDSLHVDLGRDARLDVKVAAPVPWPRRSLGGSSVFQAVPGLNQYWHPWLLGGTAQGHATVGEDTWDGMGLFERLAWGVPVVTHGGTLLGYLWLIDEPRPLSDADRADTEPVVVVNEAFARRFLGGGAVGRVITTTSTGIRNVNKRRNGVPRAPW